VAEGSWVTVPANRTLSGKPERRWQQPSGELMEVAPGLGFVAEQLRRATQGISTTPSANTGYQPGGGRMRGGRRAAATPDLNAGMTGANWPAGVPRPSTPVDSSTWPTGRAPVLSDDRDARASEATRMLQQATPFWEREENKALKVAAGPVDQGGGPRAGEAGYAQRADIAAWIEANKNSPKGADGKNIVDRFLDQQRAKGLLDAPGQPGGFGSERIAMPVDAESAAQAGQRGLVGFDGTALQQAQANVSELQGRERAAMTQQIWQAAAEDKLPSLVAAGAIPGNLKTDWANYTPSDKNLIAYSGTDFGLPAAEILRGAPLTASGDPTEALAPGSNRPGQPQAGYGGATVADVFNGPAALPSQSTTAGVVPPDTGMTPVREQGVPGLTEPPPSPLNTRDRNLNPATQLVNNYLGRARLYTQGGMR
jgi:hypothetical protein